MEWWDKLRERFGIERMTQTTEHERQQEEVLHEGYRTVEGALVFPLSREDIQAAQRDATRNVRELGGRATEEHGFPVGEAQQRPSREYLNRLRQERMHGHQHERGLSHGW